MPTTKELASGLTADDFRAAFRYDRETGLFQFQNDVFVGRPGRLFRRAGDIAGADQNGYVDITLNYKKFRAHRVAWLMETGAWPVHEIDHIDMNRKNNAWANLREATGNQNRANSKPRSKLGLKGVGQAPKAKNTFFAQITHNNRNIYLGSFKSPQEAHEAYCKKARELYGEFARTA